MRTRDKGCLEFSSLVAAFILAPLLLIGCASERRANAKTPARDASITKVATEEPTITGVFGLPLNELVEFCKSSKSDEELIVCMATMTVYSPKRVKFVNRFDMRYIAEGHSFGCDNGYTEIVDSVARRLYGYARSTKIRDFYLRASECKIAHGVHGLLFGEEFNLSQCSFLGPNADVRNETIRVCVENILHQFTEERIFQMRRAILDHYKAARNEFGVERSTAYQMDDESGVAKKRTTAGLGSDRFRQKIFTALRTDLNLCTSEARRKADGTLRADVGARNLRQLLLSGSTYNLTRQEIIKKRIDESLLKTSIDCDELAEVYSDLFDDVGGLLANYRAATSRERAMACSANRQAGGPNAKEVRGSIGVWLESVCSKNELTELFLNPNSGSSALPDDQRGMGLAGLSMYKFTGTNGRCEATSEILPHYFFGPESVELISARPDGARRYQVAAEARIACGSNGTPLENALACGKFGNDQWRFDIESRWNEKTCAWETEQVIRHHKN